MYEYLPTSNYLIVIQSNENKTRFSHIIDSMIVNAESEPDALNKSIPIFKSRSNQTNKTIQCQIFTVDNTETEKQPTTQHDPNNISIHEYLEHNSNITIDPTIPKCIDIKRHNWIEISRKSRKWEHLNKQHIIHKCKLCNATRHQKTQTKREDIIFTEIEYDT